MNAVQPRAEKEWRQSCRQALVLLGYPLAPDRDAGSLRMHHLLRLLHSFDFSVTVGILDGDAGAVSETVSRAVPIRVLASGRPESVAGHLARCGPEYALVMLSSVAVAITCLRAVLDHAPDAVLVFDTTDLQHVRQYRRGKLTGKAGWLEMAMRTKKWELATARAADATLVVSSLEQALLERESPGARVYVLSHVFDVSDAPPAFSEREGIVFVGSFSHHPNADAVEHFVKEVLPILRRELGGVRVVIIGPDPPEWLAADTSSDLVVTGHVVDAAAYLRRCRLSVAPLRYGAGVKGKVLLSMACGAPVVASSVAAEGIPLTNGVHVLVADSPVEFSAAVARLYSDKRLWDRCSRAGLALVAEHYSVDAARRAMAALLQAVHLL